MPTVNAMQGLIMGGLQPQLQPYLIPLLMVFTEQVEDRLRHAVRAGADAEANDIRLADGLTIHRAEHLHFSKGAGIGLEIGQIALCPVNELRLMGELFGDGAMLLRFIGKRGHVTESATAAAQRAVAVRAAKTAVQRQLMDLFAIAAHKIPTKHID
jgi:Arc/MetJ family transcription regulator